MRQGVVVLVAVGLVAASVVLMVTRLKPAIGGGGGTVYTQAVSDNRSNGRVLLVKFTAEWCGPCKKMDETTWVDPQVVSWLKDYGQFVAVDVDEDPALASSMSVAGMPTIVAFRDGEEVDRVMGYQSADPSPGWRASGAG